MSRILDSIAFVGQLFIFPQVCCLCSRPVISREWAPLCDSCFQNLPRFKTALCPVCGIPAEGRCALCKGNSSPYSRARAFGPYHRELRDLIWKYKYGGLKRLGHPLSRLLLIVYKEHFAEEPPDFLVAVPSHRKRSAERGFDHVGRLVRPLSRETGLPVFKNLRREVNTRPQFGLEMDERMRNLQGAFSMNHSRALRGKSILLVDDVMTTGTTILQISNLLRRRSSVDKIDVLTIARVPRFQEG